MAKNAFVVAIIRDDKKLRASIDTAIKASASLHDRLHVNAVSSILHAAEHGRVELLNRFYAGLRPAYQLAFRVYVGKHTGKLIDGKFTGFLSFTKAEGFAVIKDRMELRKEFMNSAEALLKAARFFDREVSKGEDVFDDNALKTALARLIKRAGKAHDEGTVSEQAFAVLNNLAKAMAEAEKMPAPANVPAVPAAPAPEEKSEAA